MFKFLCLLISGTFFSIANSDLQAQGESRYVIQVGGFTSEDRAKGWVNILNHMKIPNYILSKHNPDGTVLYVLRAGPFRDKDTAEDAEKKIKGLNLSPRLVVVDSHNQAPGLQIDTSTAVSPVTRGSISAKHEGSKKCLRMGLIPGTDDYNRCIRSLVI